MPSSDSSLPIPANVPIDSSRPCLKGLFDAYSDGRIGTPQKRLAALCAKVVSDRLLKRIKALPLTETSSIYLRMLQGEALEVILSDENATP